MGRANRGLVHLQDVQRGVGFGSLKGIHPHQNILSRIQSGLFAGGCLLNPQLGPAGLDGEGHAALRFYLAKRFPGFVDQCSGEGFQAVGTAQGVYHLANSGGLLQEQLGVAGNPGGKVRGKGNGFVQRVGVQALGASQCCGQGLNGGAAHVVEGGLFGQTPSRRLAVGAQGLAFCRGSAFVAHDLGPQHAGGAHFGHFRPKVHADGPEKRQPGGKVIDRQTRGFSRTEVLPSVGQGEGQFQSGRGSRFLHVVPGNGNAVEFGHEVPGVRKNIRHNPHAGLGRVDVGIAHHELLQNVVLNGSLEGRRGYALFFCCDDVKGQDGQDGPVHGHGDGHLVQGNAVKQDFGILDAVYGDACFSDVPLHPRVVGVVPAVGGQVKGDAESFLAGGQVSSVKRVAFFGSGKSGILPNGPRALGVHGSVRTAQKGRQARGHGLQSGGCRAVSKVGGRGRRCRCKWFGRCFCGRCLGVGRIGEGKGSGCVALRSIKIPSCLHDVVGKGLYRKTSGHGIRRSVYRRFVGQQEGLVARPPTGQSTPFLQRGRAALIGAAAGGADELPLRPNQRVVGVVPRVLGQEALRANPKRSGFCGVAVRLHPLGPRGAQCAQSGPLLQKPIAYRPMHPKPGDEFGAHCGNQLVPLLNRQSQRRNRGKGIGIFRACDPLHAGVHRQPNPFRQHVGLGLQSGAGGSGIPRALPPVGIHAQRPPAFQPAVQKSHFVGFYDQVNGNNVCLDAGQQFSRILVSVHVKEQGGCAIFQGF